MERTRTAIDPGTVESDEVRIRIDVDAKTAALQLIDRNSRVVAAFGPGCWLAAVVIEDEKKEIVMETAKEHLAWCVERAMEYANTGDMTNAWASFVSDVGEHEGTKHIRHHELTAMMMISGLANTPKTFKDFIEGWNV